MNQWYQNGYGILTVTLLAGLLGCGERSLAANPDHVSRLLKTNQCPACDLSGANLADANLFGANLVNAKLAGANLSGANLGSANLTDADLSSANLSRAYLHQAILENTNFSQANLSGAYLRDAVVQDTRLDGANLQGSNLSRTNLVGISLKGVDLTQANLSSAILSGVRSPTSNRQDQSLTLLFGMSTFTSGNRCLDPDSPDVREASRYGFKLGLADLSGSKLRGANLSNAILFNGNLSGADLSGANLTEAILVCSNLTNATLTGADLRDARLERAVVAGANLQDAKNANSTGTFKSTAEVQAQPIETEAKQYVSSMLRAQQAYYLEKERFAAQLSELGLGIRPETQNYLYRIFPYRDRTKAVMVAGVPKKNGFKSYVGFVNLGKAGDDWTTFTILCASNAALPNLPKMPASFPTTSAATCPSGFQSVR